MIEPGPENTQKAGLLRYLGHDRDALVWKLDGLSDYDVRRPLTPTGTNLLGLVKHVASVAVGYLGETFDRPYPGTEPWLSDDAELDSDLWVPADQTRADVLAFHESAWAHSLATAEALDLDAAGHVPWWSPERAEVSLHQVLIHLVEETGRHAGHADILRELIDAEAGLRVDSTNLPDRDAAGWASHRDRIEQAARSS